MSTRHTLALSGAMHQEIRRHLFPGDGKEAVVIALCAVAAGSARTSFLVQSIYPVPYDACRIRAVDRVAWTPEAVVPALTEAMNRTLRVVKIHSHPNGYEAFSLADDESDRAFFDSVLGWLDSDEPQVSAIMLPSGEMFGRTVWPDRLGPPLSDIRVAGDDISFWRRVDGEGAAPEYARRVWQTFGDDTYNKLRGLRIGVVGCSGTGSIVVEQLVRNCVGELVLVDPDSVEDKNLNRILNSTMADAVADRSKVEVLSRVIANIGLGTVVTPLHADLENSEVVQHLASCDVLFGCMDSIDGRHLLNKLASFYVIPLVDVGVRIDADGKGGIDQICVAVHYIQPGGSSLLSRGVYDQEDLNAAFMRRCNPDQHAKLLKEGYVRNARVDQPAVISINMQAASLAVNELLARLHPFRVDPNREYAYRRQILSDPPASGDTAEGMPCPTFARWVALGDVEPPLGLQRLAKKGA